MAPLHLAAQKASQEKATHKGAGAKPGGCDLVPLHCTSTQPSARANGCAVMLCVIFRSCWALMLSLSHVFRPTPEARATNVLVVVNTPVTGLGVLLEGLWSSCHLHVAADGGVSRLRQGASGGRVQPAWFDKIFPLCCSANA